MNKAEKVLHNKSMYILNSEYHQEVTTIAKNLYTFTNRNINSFQFPYAYKYDFRQFIDMIP